MTTNGNGSTPTVDLVVDGVTQRHGIELVVGGARAQMTLEQASALTADIGTVLAIALMGNRATIQAPEIKNTINRAVNKVATPQPIGQRRTRRKTVKRDLAEALQWHKTARGASEYVADVADGVQAFTAKDQEANGWIAAINGQLITEDPLATKKEAVTLVAETLAEGIKV